MAYRIAGSLAAFAAGAAWLQTRGTLPHAPGAVLLALVACTGAAAIAGRASRTLVSPTFTDIARIVGAVAVLAAAFSAGYSYAAWRAHLRLDEALPSAWEARDIRVVGIVDDLPHADAEGARFALAVERAETAGAFVPERISLGWYAPRRADTGADLRPVAVPIIHAGERWRLTVRLIRPHGNVNPHGFDVEAWLLERNLRATGYVRDAPDNARIDAFAGRVTDHVQRIRETVRARIARALPEARYAGVLTALAIGDQRSVPESQWTVFNRTGVTHLISISGLHVTVFASLAGAAALACVRRWPTVTSRVPAPKIAAAVGALFAFGYVLLAGAEVPAVRTLLMVVIACVGLWLARPGTALHVWLWALVVVLLWDPWATLAPGFWLSFGAVGLLLYAGSGRPQAPFAAGWRAKAVRAVREGARAQWVVTVGLVPGTLALFQQVSLVSALANAVAIPVVTVGVVPLTLLAMATPADWPWQIAHRALALLMRYLEALARMPMASWPSHAPRGWTVMLAIGGVLWLLAPRGVPGRTFGVAWMLPLGLIGPPAVPEGAVRITVLDVGQGLAVFVATARHALVYDTGPRFNGTLDAGGRIVEPYLRAIGVGHLDALVVSHADTDHSGGALSILRSFPGTPVVSSLSATHPVVVAASASRRCVAGDLWVWDRVIFTIEHPAESQYAEARKSNDLSCVLRIDAGGAGVVLTGDIEAKSEAELLRRTGVSLRADVVVVPHHGSMTSSSPAFVAAVAPRIAVIAAGYRNRFGHPRAEIVERYRVAGAVQLRTDRDGAVTVVLGDGATRAVATRHAARRYWYDEVETVPRTR
ncbi:MAG: DNA internalization-related competence protein ComEC/Rec2 [Betaproteobacteria bacterium]